MNTNLLKLWEQAGPAEIDAGKNWYDWAHTWADSLAFWTNRDLSQVCAVVSALSPQLSWRKNRDAAERILRGEEPKGILSASRRKAELILRGARPGATAFPVRSCPKTNSFYHNLLNPRDPRFVTIDRHAARAAGYDWARFEYERVAQEYREASRWVGLTPCQFQAVLWIIQRNGGQRSFPFALGEW